MLPGNYTTTTTNYKSTDYASTSTSNLQIPLDALKSRASGHYRTRKGTEFGRRLALRNVKTAPDPKDRSVTSQAQQLQPWLQRFSDWGNWVGEQFAVALIGDDDAVRPPKDSVEPVTPGQKQKPAKSEVSANGRSGDYRSMDFFLKRIEGKFTCERLGKPCIAVPEETLRGMKVVIGNAHSEISEEWAEDLLMRFKRPGDKLIVEATSSELEDDVTRRAFCLGFSRENCIAGEIENLKDQLDAGLANLVELRFQRLSFLDPEEAFRIRVNHSLEETTRLMILINEAYVPRMRMLWPSLTAEQIETVRQLTEAIDSADEEFRLLMQQTMDARNQNYVRLLQGQMGNRETTTYVMVGTRHVPGVMEAFSTTDTVLALYPVVRGEPRRTARRYV